jgi:hypothetical protein
MFPKGLDKNKGKLKTEKQYLATCAECLSEQDVGGGSYATAELSAHDGGWRRRKNGWVCPECAGNTVTIWADRAAREGEGGRG